MTPQQESGSIRCLHTVGARQQRVSMHAHLTSERGAEHAHRRGLGWNTSGVSCKILQTIPHCAAGVDVTSCSQSENRRQPAGHQVPVGNVVGEGAPASSCGRDDLFLQVGGERVRSLYPAPFRETHIARDIFYVFCLHVSLDS